MILFIILGSMPLAPSVFVAVRRQLYIIALALLIDCAIATMPKHDIYDAYTASAFSMICRKNGFISLADIRAGATYERISFSAYRAIPSYNAKAANNKPLHRDVRTVVFTARRYYAYLFLPSISSITRNA